MSIRHDVGHDDADHPDTRHSSVAAPARPAWWRRPIVRTAAIVATAVAVSVPTTALALGDRFSDVPASNPFVADIESMADAGITTGFPDGTYRPGQPVTRGSMAAFLGRGVGRLTTASGEGFLGSGQLPGGGGGGTAVVASTTVTNPAEGEGAIGHYLVMADVRTQTLDASTCPCQVVARLLANGSPLPMGGVTIGTLGGAAADNGSVVENLSVTEVIGAVAGAEPTFAIQVEIQDANATSFVYEGSITTLYVPFGPSNT